MPKSTEKTTDKSARAQAAASPTGGAEAESGTELLSAALGEAIARKIRLGELSSAGGLKHEALKRRVLGGYRRSLDGAEDADVLVWLLERLATVEAQVIALQQGAIGIEAGAPREPLRQEPPAKEPLPREPAARTVRRATTRKAEAAPAAAAPQSQPQPAPASAPKREPAAPSRPSLPRHVITACDESLVHKGFYDAERSPQGRSFRWIGPEPRGSVFLPRIEMPGEVRLHIYGVFVREAVALVKVSIDKGAWEPAKIVQGRDGIVLVARPVPGETGSPQVMRVDIDAAMSDSPSNRGEDDFRTLSIALSAIEAASVGA